MKKIILTISLLFSSFLIFAASAIMLADYKKALEEFASTSNISPDMMPKADEWVMKKFPLPQLKISYINHSAGTELKDINIKFSLLSILKFAPKVSDFRIGEAKIHLASNNITFLNHDELISSLISKSSINVDVTIAKISFIESDNDVSLEINNFVLASSTDDISFTGKVGSSEKISGSLAKQKEAGRVIFTLNTKTSNYSVDLTEEYQDASIVSGKMHLLTTNLPAQISAMAPELNQFFDELSTGEEIKIDLDLEGDKEGIKFHNITIASNNVEGKGTGYSSKSKERASSFNFEFSKIDLDAWKKSKTATSEQNFSRPQSLTSNNFNLRNNPVKGDLKINQLKLSENLTISNIIFSVDTKDGSLYIQDFSGAINDQGHFKLAGALEQNDFRTLFHGQISIDSDDLNDLVEFISNNKDVRTNTKIPYQIESALKLSSVDLSLQNFNLKTPDSEISGNLSTKFIGNLPRSNGDLKISYLNLDSPNLPATGKIHQYILSLSDNMKDESYLNKFIPIRKINLIANYNISFDKITLNSQTIDNTNFGLAFTAGSVKISDLSIKDGDNYLNTDIAINAESIKPSLMIKIKDGSLKVNSLNPEAMLDLKNTLLEKIALDKIDIQLDCNLAKLYEDNFAFTRLVLVAKNTKNLIEINNFNTDLFNGRMVSSGSILLSPFTINFVYSLGGAQIGEINKILPIGLPNSVGTLNARGMWTTNGNKLNELLYNLYTNSSVMIKDSVIHNLSIDDLVQAVSASNYNDKNFDQDVKQALLTGDTKIDHFNGNFELLKGVGSMSMIQFNTIYTKAKGAFKFNLYDFSIDSDINFAFQMAKTNLGQAFQSYNLSNMKLKTTGTIFSPKKDVDTSEIVTFFNQRTKKQVILPRGN